MNIRTLSFAALTAALALSACSPKNEQSADNAASAGKAGNMKLLNVSYDVARDFYKEYNPLFVKRVCRKKTADNWLKSNSRTAAQASRLWPWLTVWPLM